MAGLVPERLQATDPEISIARDGEGRVSGNVQRAFRMLETGDVVEAPLIVNGIEEARFRWVVTTQPGCTGVAYLRLVASDNCRLTKLARDVEIEAI